jgi:hypothetical protein
MNLTSITFCEGPDTRTMNELKVGKQQYVINKDQDCSAHASSFVSRVLKSILE